MITGLRIDTVIRKELIRAGATVVGFASMKNSLSTEIAHLERAISIGVERTLNRNTVGLLAVLQKRAARTLRRRGYRSLIIPPDSDRIRHTFISKLYPLITHKMAATSAGIGWIGKNGLLISPDYGPRLSLATVLTDAPLNVNAPMEFSLCGDCTLCMDHCPSAAITGEQWSRYEPYVELIRRDRCTTHKKSTRVLGSKPNCGLCVNICPFGRKQYKHTSASIEEVRWHSSR